MDRLQTPMPSSLRYTVETAVKEAWRRMLVDGAPGESARPLTGEPATEALFDDGCNQVVVSVAFARRKVG